MIMSKAQKISLSSKQRTSEGHLDLCECPFGQFCRILEILGHSVNSDRYQSQGLFDIPCSLAAIVSVTLSQSFGQLVRSFCTGAMAKFSSIREIGFNTFLELEWSRLYVPSLLRTFWIVRLAQQLTMTLIQLALSAGKEDLDLYALLC